MVKIIKSSELKYKVTCDFCGAILGFQEVDILKSTFNDVDFPEIRHYYEFLKTPCPCCGTEVILKIDNEKFYDIYKGGE
jgi:hypothetical protein